MVAAGKSRLQLFPFLLRRNLGVFFLHGSIRLVARIVYLIINLRILICHTYHSFKFDSTVRRL